jgi:phage-related protein
MELTIQRLNGDIYNLIDYGIQTLDFQIDAPSPRILTETIEGRDGNIDLGATYDARQIKASFFMSVPEEYDFSSLRNEVFRIFASNETFYVIDSREPDRRWLVRSNGFSIEQLRDTRGRFNIDFTSQLPYAESVLNTLDPNVTAAQVTSTGSVTVAYKQTVNQFDILNDGDIAVDPRIVPLTITYKGASTNLKIKNVTTGDEWQYTGTTSSGDSVVLDGIRATKNGLSIFRDTNHSLITLAPGWNTFELTGASGTIEISFDFRFYTI